MLEKQNLRLNSQTAFDVHKTREDYCANWLKQLQKSVSKKIFYAAFCGVLNGIFYLLQIALIAFLLHQLIIEKQLFFANIDLQILLQIDTRTLFTDLFSVNPSKNTIGATHLQLACILLVCIFLARSICVYYSHCTGFDAAAIIKLRLRSQLQNKFPKLSSDYLKQQQTGALAETVLEQVDALELYFSRYCPQKLIAFCLPLLMIICVFPINWVVAVIFFSCTPLMLLFMALVGMGATAASRKQFVFMARMGGYFLDRLQGITTLKLFGATQTELENIRRVGDDFNRSTMAVLRIAFLSSAVLEFFSAVAVALVAVYVGLGLLGLIHFADANKLTLQQGLFLLMVAPEFFMPLKQLAQYYHDKAAAIGAADLILTTLEASERKTSPIKKSSAFCIELLNLSKSYEKRQIFKNLSLQIKHGEKVALVGSSGSGKTTLLRLLLGLEEADNGEITLTSDISYVPQRSSIFKGTIKDNISLFNSAISEQSILTAASLAGVSAFTDQLPLKLETMIGENGYGLSGGQIQRIALARALLNNAPLILLDEPTAHLDKENKIRLLDTIEKLFNDKTIIIASHDETVINRMQRRFDIESF